MVQKFGIEADYEGMLIEYKQHVSVQHFSRSNFNTANVTTKSMNDCRKHATTVQSTLEESDQSVGFSGI